MNRQGADISETDARKPRARRMAQFVIERFPPIPQLVLVALLVVSGMTMATTLWSPAQSLQAAPMNLGTVLITLVGGVLFIFRLRVFDDVKDANTDRVNAPERPIPRGLISEREADLLATILVVCEAFVFAAVGWLAFTWWVVAAVYTLGMRVEFGVGSWLDRHVLTYAISHMMCLGLVLAALIGAGIEAMGLAQGIAIADVPASRGIVLACASAVLLGVGFELGRKFERYEQAHGDRAWIALWAFPVSGIGVMLLGVHDAYGEPAMFALAGIAIATFTGGVMLTIRRPRGTISWIQHGTMREMIEALPGLAGLGTYLALTIAGCLAASW